MIQTNVADDCVCAGMRMSRIIFLFDLIHISLEKSDSHFLLVITSCRKMCTIKLWLECVDILHDFYTLLWVCTSIYGMY